MPIQVTCSGCGVSLSTPDTSAGKRAQCPQCGGEIQIPDARGKDPLLEGEKVSGAQPGEQRKPCPACGEMIMPAAVKCRFCGEVLDSSLKGVLKSSRNLNDPAWLQVRSGLNTIYNCMGTIFGTALLIGILAAVLGALNVGQKGGNEPPALMILFGLGGLLIIGAAIGIFVGYVRCTNVPPESGAHGYAVGAVICTVGNVLLSIAGGVAQSEAISGIGSLISLIGGVLFILFIRRSAAYLDDSELASSAGKFLMFGAALFVGCFMIGIFTAVGSQAILAIVGIGVIVGGLVGFIWFLRLIRGLRTTIDLCLESQPSSSPFAY